MEDTPATIIAGRFDEKEQAEAIGRELAQAGFSEERRTCFFVSPPGHHDRFPVGGDRDESPGATGADDGALKGAGVGGAIGLGIGLAASPVAGPAAVAAGAGVGAYVGSLAGALNRMGHPDAPPRRSGFLVAVQVNDGGDENAAVRILQAAGAHDIERTQGRWQAGKWTDFDPTRPPVLVTDA